MSLYRKKSDPNSEVVTACRWWKNGDHPQDDCRVVRPVPGDGEPFLSEGKVVRYYRDPYDSGDRTCEMCGETMHDHGWIDSLGGGHIVCPGNYVITDGAGHYPATREYFRATYEMVVP